MSEQVVEPEQNAGPEREILLRWRLIAFLAALAIELAIYFGAMVFPIDPVQQKALLDTANQISNSTVGQAPVGVFSAISANNLRVALLEAVPGVGAFLFVISSFTTGQVIQVLSLSSSLPGIVYGMLLLFFPFAIVELSAYAMAVSSGTMVILAWRKKSLRREMRVFGLEVAGVIGVVLVAAAMETAVIVDPFVGFALWLPTALAIAAAAVYGRGHRA